MRKVLKWLGLGVVGVIAALLIIGGGTLLAAGLLYRDTGGQPTPSGRPRDTSFYLTMRDGTRIAIDVWLPKDLKRGEHVPVLIKGTPYWRAFGHTFLGKALAELGLMPIDGDPDTPMLNARGYAVIVADTRGTGASFGSQKILFDNPEVADFGEIIDWAARQPWSNGRVGAYGFSYRGALAVSMASLGRPALKAIAPSFDLTDMYLTARPGGVFSDRFLQKWGSQTAALNRGEPPCEGVCRWLISGPKRVDADRDGALLKAALAEHRGNENVYMCARAATGRDSPFCDSGKSLTDVSEIARQGAVERAALPIYVIAGYFDATLPAQALRRYQTFSNRQQVLIGAISHGGFQTTDPFAAKMAGVDPPYERQIAGMADFFDRYLKADGPPIAPEVRYAVLNGGGWKTTAAWPPHDATPTRLYLGARGELSRAAPTAEEADFYRVDFSASTGELSRYQSPVDLSSTAYPDRAAQDRKLLTYTSAPLASDLEVAGDPVADLSLATTTPDGEVVVYLEDVRPNGAVIYLTEGVLRLAYRKASSPGGGALSSDPLHSYLTADAGPMTPGRSETIELGLSPIAVVFRKGDRIRVAVAGADAANLERIPSAGEETFTLRRGPGSPSFVELPVIAAR